MVSEPVLELFTTSALPLEELVLIVLTLGTDKILAKSTCGRGAGATPVAMAVSKQQDLT
jgi:hypothetical protein